MIFCESAIAATIFDGRLAALANTARLSIFNSELDLGKRLKGKG
ncbi:hypothetical protein [Nostoc sp. ChiSLP03a]|nr:hypothetical protein [Nostoc sp. ChiSLP03a]